MYAAISAKRQVAGQHLCFIMLHECQWSSPVFDTSGLISLANGSYQRLGLISHRPQHVGAYWKEGSAPIGSIPRALALKKEGGKKPWKSAKFRRWCGWFKFGGRKANKVRTYSSHWWERKQRARQVSSLFHVSPTCLFSVFIHIVSIAVFGRSVRAAKQSCGVATLETFFGSVSLWDVSLYDLNQ